MFVKDMLNASVEALEHSLGENSSNVPELSLKNKKPHYDFDDDRKELQYKFIVISTFFTLIYVWAWFVQFKQYHRPELWYAIHNWLIVGLITEKFTILTRFDIFSAESIEMGEYKGIKHTRRYFLTLYAYIVMALAFYSYNLIFKTLFKSPVSSYQIYKHWVVIYILSCFPTLYFLFAYGWNERVDSPLGYFSYTWQFDFYPEKHDMAIVLLCCYIIPACVTLLLMGRVAIELMKRKEFFFFYKQENKYSLCIADRIFLAIAFYACFAFGISSVSFVTQEALRCPHPIDTNKAEITEKILFCNLYMQPCFFLMLYGYYCFIYKFPSVDLRSEMSFDDKDLSYCDYKTTSIQFFRSTSEKSVNKSPEVEEETFVSEKHKIKNEIA